MATSAPAITAPTLLRIRLAPELSLAAVTYGDPRHPPVLCTHGWMDNCSTYEFVGPALAAAGLYAVCVEFPGHGHSDHRPPSAHYVGVEYAANVVEAVTALGWERFALCGHSLGAGMVSIVAGSLPRGRVVGLILLEGIGPSTRPTADGPAMFARAVAAKAAAGGRDGSLYASVDEAVDQRLATVARYEGNQTLSRHAAEGLVRRALIEVEIALPAGVVAAQQQRRGHGAAGAAPAGAASPSVAGGAGGDDSPTAQAPPPTAGDAGLTRVKRWRFRHDRRIIGPSLSYLHEEQVCAFLGGISCPTLAVTATRGWPRDAGVYAHRLAVLGAASAALTHVTLPGGHHLHADPDTAPAVCDAVRGWVAATLLPAFAAAAAAGTAPGAVK